MTKFGLTLSGEELPPERLVAIAAEAEHAGFDFVSISDHFHPWIPAQGHSPFVWSILGAIAQATDRIEVCVGVTCPIMRMHPAVIAHAVATSARLLEDRFIWGVGTGEALNEHITGLRWPPAPVRLDMLSEAVQIVRELLTGANVTHYGDYYTVEDATLFDAPDDPPLIVFSAFGSAAARRAARDGDGLWITGVDTDTICAYRDAGGTGPIWTQLSVSWDRDEDAAAERAHRMWPNAGVPGQLSQDLRTPFHFEEACELVTREQIVGSIPCGPAPEPIVEGARKAAEAGADHVYFHQIGDPGGGFIDFFSSELRPVLSSL